MSVTRATPNTLGQRGALYNLESMAVMPVPPERANYMHELGLLRDVGSVWPQLISGYYEGYPNSNHKTLEVLTVASTHYFLPARLVARSLGLPETYGLPINADAAYPSIAQIFLHNVCSYGRWHHSLQSMR